MTDAARPRRQRRRAGRLHRFHSPESGRGRDGTTATLCHRLSRPARLLTADQITAGTIPPPPRPDTPALLLILDQPHTTDFRVRLDGPIDVTTAPQLHTELARATRGGSRSLTIDLTGVTHLASAGVAVLHQAAARNTSHGTQLRLYTPPGSTAQHILTLVALAHTTHDPTPPAF